MSKDLQAAVERAEIDIEVLGGATDSDVEQLIAAARRLQAVVEWAEKEKVDLSIPRAERAMGQEVLAIATGEQPSVAENIDKVFDRVDQHQRGTEMPPLPEQRMGAMESHLDELEARVELLENDAVVASRMDAQGHALVEMSDRIEKLEREAAVQRKELLDAQGRLRDDVAALQKDNTEQWARLGRQKHMLNDHIADATAHKHQHEQRGDDPQVFAPGRRTSGPLEPRE